MNNIQNDLVKICKKLNLKTFKQVRGYAARFKKYNSMTFRNIDEVVTYLEK